MRTLAMLITLGCILAAGYFYEQSADDKKRADNAEAVRANLERDLENEKEENERLRLDRDRDAKRLAEALARLAAPAPKTAAAPAPFDANLSARSVVIIKGDEKQGSGFVGNTKNGPRLFTNGHVLSGLHSPVAKLENGVEVHMDDLSYADGIDVMQIADKALPPGLDIAENLDGVSVGDQVVVVGNSLGGGVATHIEGVVKGIGPNLVEVDAPFVPGNSGSPVIHVKTGKVIGIATYVTVQKEVLNGVALDFSTGRAPVRLPDRQRSPVDGDLLAAYQKQADVVGPIETKTRASSSSPRTSRTRNSSIPRISTRKTRSTASSMIFPTR